MTLNEERDIALKAFYYDLDKGHRINESRVIAHLKTTDINHDRINTIILDLEKEGYIERIPFKLGEFDFKITHKGERLIEEHGGFGEWKQKEQQPSVVNNINTGGGNITGSQVGNQSRDFLEGSKNINTTITKTDSQYVASNEKPKTLIGKILAWINNNKILCTLIAAIIYYFIKIELDKRYTPYPSPQSHKTEDVKTVKKL